MFNTSRTARAETVLSRQAKTEISKALERRDAFQRQGIKTLARAAMAARITVVVKMSVAAFLTYCETEAHSRYMAHLELCGCRASGAACETGDALLIEWRSARDLVEVDA